MKKSVLFELRGTLSRKISTVIMLIGFVGIIVFWQLITTLTQIPPSILPSPMMVITSLPELHFENALVRNSIYSIRLNLLGYLEAVAISIPIGFMIGLFPVFRAMMDKYVQAMRFIPLAATTGLFIIWFGIYDNMKVQFLACSIVVYLLPVVVQRIDEVEKVYEQTAFTLGASKRQMIFTVYLPAVLSRIIDDIRVLVAISWTYITIAEALNMTGGIGALAYKCARQSRTDKVFAVLAIIILIGFVQDKLFKILDKKIFPFKYQ
ncbi:MAG: ABC transporter permease subunit [Leptospiraceae bacterium]|nr:ABC transporter permease subunit [Leptospiraceae bacterium]MCP5496267.1 ABC transporter permease subunit [Leptospiraceae bacterium]